MRIAGCEVPILSTDLPACLPPPFLSVSGNRSFFCARDVETVRVGQGRVG